MPSYAKRIAKNRITGKLIVLDAPLREKEKCIVCGGKMLVAPGQIAKYCSKACRKLRHNKSNKK